VPQAQGCGWICATSTRVWVDMCHKHKGVGGYVPQAQGCGWICATSTRVWVRSPPPRVVSCLVAPPTLAATYFGNHFQMSHVTPQFCIIVTSRTITPFINSRLEKCAHLKLTSSKKRRSLLLCFWYPHPAVTLLFNAHTEANLTGATNLYSLG
jgi:hypothetical protein